MGDAETLGRYARLVVKVGLNLQPGQRLAIGCLVDHAPLARAIASQAYTSGARYVDVLYTDQVVRRAHVEHVSPDDLGWSPPWLVSRLDGLGADGGALLAMTGNPDPDLFEGLDGERVARARMRALAEASFRLAEGACNWAIVASPNEGWARTVFGEPDVERLWAAVANAVRLDEPDPVAAWRAHVTALTARAARLNDLALDALRFRGPGTDLTVGLHADSVWVGGSFESRGISHVPNMPTEEVFTTPDARRVEGTVATTYPLPLQGALVRGLRVRFEQGRAVEIDADQGQDLIRAHLATDEGSARLGEVSLVDRSSRVGRQGVVFYDVLLDENAASHIAFGAAILRTVGREGLPPEERQAQGINVSSLHTDVMIGSAEIGVDGITRAGDEVALMRDGAFLLD